MRGEFQVKKIGEKWSTIKKLVPRHTDILILTETRVHASNVHKKSLPGMVVSHHSLQNDARKGVIIYSKREHPIMDGSTRESREPGLFAAAV
jgi:exonuclease III